MANRTDIQQLVIPEEHQQLLKRIAAAEERSMSGSVRVMISRRAQELGLIQRGGYDESAQEEAERQAA